MKVILGLFGAVALASLSFPASAQAPQGSFQQSCRDIRMQGSTLTAVCRRADGREQPTSLGVARCVGDIGNNNGQLQCNGGQSASPAPTPRQGGGPGYPGPGNAPPPGYGQDRRWGGEGYPGPGYAPRAGYDQDPRWSEAQEFRAHCEQLRGVEHELRDRLQYTPPSYERERLEHRLRDVHAEREQCWRR
jgi:CVNH domain